MKRIFTYLCLLSLFLFNSAWAEIQTQTVDYTDHGTKLEGYLAFDDSNKNPAPGILIAHDWMGLGQFTKNKANELAKEGYVVFAVDVYGKGTRPKNQQEAPNFAKKYREDRALLRSRMQAAYDKFITMKQVDNKKIVVMGYCFGGMAALELARSGAPLVGTVVFHGTLSNPTPEDAKNIKGSVLVLHGADDPNVPPSEVDTFKKEMKDAGVPLEFIAYPGAVHAFTLPAAGSDKSKGVAYNAEADKKSWEELHRFLKKVFNN